jgi:hypothetical protein
MPSPQERPAEPAEGRGGKTVELRNLNSDPFAALVFKTTSEPHVGELSYFRVFGGSVANGAEVHNASREKTEKLAHLSIPQGRERVEVDALRAGDIGVVAKLKDTHTNDTLSAPRTRWCWRGSTFPSPTSRWRWRRPRGARRTSSPTGAPQAARGGPLLHRRVRARAGADHRPRAGRAAPGRAARAAEAQERGRGGGEGPPHPLPRDHPRRRRGPRAAQEADGRARPVRRRARAPEAAAPAARATASPTRSWAG